MQQNSLISLEDAGVYRQGRWLIRHVDLEVAQGEIVTLIGPNGSGKSTTVKSAVGLMAVDEGCARRKPDLKIGYVPQKFNVDATLPLSVERLIKLGARYNAGQVADALDLVGMSGREKQMVQHLSGGELQRVLLARAFIARPDLLVLDEPVQGVDYAGEAALYDLIGRFRDETGCGVLLISHDLHVVMAKTDRVLCLNGHVCCTGTPESVMSSKQYSELFGTRAAESIAIYRHHHDHTHLSDGRVLHADGSVTDYCHTEDGHHEHSSSCHMHERDNDGLVG